MAFLARSFRGLLASIACAPLALAAACSEESIDPRPEQVESYVGAIAGSDAVFAVTATEHEVVLYVCGGPTSLERSRWYRGERTNGEPAQLTATDGSTAVVRFGADAAGDERIDGQVMEAGGTILELEAGLTGADTVAGLYGVVDSGCRTGVVVQQGSAEQEPVVQGTWCSDEGIFAQVTPIAPIETQGGFAVQVMVPAAQGRGVRTRSLVVEGINPADL